MLVTHRPAIAVILPALGAVRPTVPSAMSPRMPSPVRRAMAPTLHLLVPTDIMATIRMFHALQCVLVKHIRTGSPIYTWSDTM